MIRFKVVSKRGSKQKMFEKGDSGILSIQEVLLDTKVKVKILWENGNETEALWPLRKTWYSFEQLDEEAEIPEEGGRKLKFFFWRGSWVLLSSYRLKISI